MTLIERKDLVTRLREADWHDPKCPYTKYCYCGDDENPSPHDKRQHPDAIEAADRIEALEAALLAANELAEAAEAMLRMMDDVIKGSGKGDMAIKPDGSMGVIDGWKRLASYRRAIAGGEA